MFNISYDLPRIDEIVWEIKWSYHNEDLDLTGDSTVGAFSFNPWICVNPIPYLILIATCTD